MTTYTVEFGNSETRRIEAISFRSEATPTPDEVRKQLHGKPFGSVILWTKTDFAQRHGLGVRPICTLVFVPERKARK